MPLVHLTDLLFPDRDVGFGRRIAELSEPESGPAADNLVSNEDSYPRVAGELARRTPKDAVYLGVGPDQNYTLMAHARPRLGTRCGPRAGSRCISPSPRCTWCRRSE